ncbi:MAG: hypothetical protein AB7F28_02755 [Candidatus Margulisiibacteriota bacterium]
MKKNILVISKSAVAPALIQLVAHPHQVHHRPSLSEALAYVQNDEGQPDLLIIEDTTVISPSPISLRHFKASYPQTPIMALMTHNDPSWKGCVDHAGATHCFYGSIVDDRKLKRAITKLIKNVLPLS